MIDDRSGCNASRSFIVSSKLRFLAIIGFCFVGLLASHSKLLDVWNKDDTAYSFTAEAPNQALLPKSQMDAINNDAQDAEKLPICLNPPFYAGHNNQIISIARALEEAHLNSTKLVLGLGWHHMYSTTFELHPDIVLLPKTELPLLPERCLTTLTGKDAFFLRGGPYHYKNYFLREVTELVPKQEIRQKAMDVISSDYHNRSFISVHRRWLEDSCYERAQLRKNFGSVESCTTEEMVRACNFTFPGIPNPNNRTLVLLTDGQMPSMDQTFPIQDKQNLNVQMWMMTQSETHYGNPASSVDWVVMHWRRSLGKLSMEPAACYPSEISPKERNPPPQNVLSHLWGSLSRDERASEQKEVNKAKVKVTTNSSTPANTLLPVCLIQPFFGGLNNQIISIALSLKEAHRRSTKLVVGTGWLKKFTSTFEHHPDVVILPKNDLPLPKKECAVRLSGRDAFHLYGGPHSKNNRFVKELTELFPSQDLRQEATNAIVNDYSNRSFISVHRRWLEDSCYDRAQSRKNFGNVESCTTEEMIKACNVTFLDISNPHNQTVVLFTDGEVPSMDQTFPIRDDRNFKVQMWMMALSETHYGNPASSVDYVVMHWRHRLRKGNMEPALCYPVLNNDNTLDRR